MTTERRRKNTCHPCLRGHHEGCTLPTRCDHAGPTCPTDDDEQTPAVAKPPAPPPSTEPSRRDRPHQARRSPTTKPADPRDPTIDFEWEDPPKRTSGRRSVGEVLQQNGVIDRLRSQPQAWARIIKYGSNTSAATAVKKLRKELGDEFEWTSKRVPRTTDDDGKGSVLYGRFVGEEA